jgi:putative multiple sugar transport system permease protein
VTTLKQSLGGNVRQYGIVGALLMIVLLFQWLTDGRLLLSNNMVSLVQQNAYVMILALGMVIVIIAGHIDLSVGSIVGFIGGVIGVAMADHGVHWFLAVLIAIALGAVVGCWQGFWVAYVGIPAFIVTLAGWMMFRGLAVVIVAITRSGFDPPFVAISNGSLPNALGRMGERDLVTLLIGGVTIAALVFSQLVARRNIRKNDLVVEPLAGFVVKLVIFGLLIGGITWIISASRGGTPIILIIVAVLILIYNFVMGRTVFGRHVYAMGGNLQAAILSGVDTKRMNFRIFVNIGMLAGIAAVVTASKAGASVANAGGLFELDAIAACFIGGTAVTGGVGRVYGVIVGALIMGVLNMGLSILAVGAEWQQVVKGLVLLLAVAFDLINKRRAGTR